MQSERRNPGEDGARDFVVRCAGETFTEPRRVELSSGEAWIFTAAAPDRDGAPNEDALAIAESNERLLLAVADGVGGRRGGHRASKLVCDTVAHALEYPTNEPERSVVDAIHRANLELTEDPDAGATTVAVAELVGHELRTYHVGDSTLFVAGQRGRVKLRTVDHSPVGYLLAAGNITEEEAILHTDRHYVSNAVGDLAMQVEVGGMLTLALRDTMVIGSDGLFDNLRLTEIVEIVRKGSLAKAADRLVHHSRERMVRPEPGCPSKPDDCTFILYRRR